GGNRRVTDAATGGWPFYRWSPQWSDSAAVWDPRTPAGGAERWRTSARREEAASTPRRAAPACERSRSERPADRRALGRRASRDRGEDRPEQRLPAPQALRS